MKFLEEYLYNFLNIENYHRIPICSEEKNYLINEGRNSIVKVENGKFSHSWSLEHPYSFTSPLLFCQEESSLICAVDNTTILKWFLSAETLKNAIQFQFQENIFGILKSNKCKPVILFSSGKVLPLELINVTLKPLGEGFLNTAEEKIVWADIFLRNSQVKVVCLTLSKENVYKLHGISVKKETVSRYASQIISHQNYTLKSWSLDKDDLSFIALWSNGLVTSHSLLTEGQSSLFVLTGVKENDKIALGVIDADHIVTGKSCATENETVLEMWDKKFSSVKTIKRLKTNPVEFLQIEVINSSVFLLVNSLLIEVPYYVEKSTLAAAIGKSKVTASKCEYTWKQSSVESCSADQGSIAEEKLMSIADENICEDMNTDEVINHTELLAKRFMEEGSSFKTNNRESDLLQLLQFALKAKRKKSKYNIDPEALLNAIFSSTFRDANFVHCVKKLSFAETLVILESILDFLEGKTSLTLQSASDLELFNWVFLIMKSNTEALLLSKDKKKTKLLKRLSRCMSEKIEEYKDYVYLQNMFHLLRKKENVLPTEHVIGKYFIETIHI